MRVSVLSTHRQYRCQHAGACCTAGWPIPVEADRLAVLEQAFASGRLMRADGQRAHAIVERPRGAPAETPAVLAVESHACVFYRGTGAGRCEIHRALGHDALPLACRQFPRVSLLDPRGVSVTLSHFCPTAAALLESDTVPEIVTDALAFPPSGEYVGLDVREDLPPSLRPDLLMDWDAWWRFEDNAVGLIGSAEDPMHALAALRLAVDDVRTWRPDEGALDDRVQRAFDRVPPGAVVPPVTVAHDMRLREVIEAIPLELRPDLHPPSGTAAPPSRVVRHFLAAHAFANWAAHLGQGLRTWLRSLEAAFALIDLGYGVRHADLLLRHLADPYRLARVWSGAEWEA